MKSLNFKFFIILLILLLGSCTTYTHKSGNNSNLNTDSRLCKSQANIQAPTYICRNITYCDPDETAIAMEALFRNNDVYNYCMLSKGYVSN